MNRRTEVLGKRARTPISRLPRLSRGSGAMRASKRAGKAWTVSAGRFAVVGFRLASRTAISTRTNLTAPGPLSYASGRIRLSNQSLTFVQVNCDLVQILAPSLHPSTAALAAPEVGYLTGLNCWRTDRFTVARWSCL